MLKQFVQSLTFALVFLCGHGFAISIRDILEYIVHAPYYDHAPQRVLKPEEIPFKPMTVATPAFGSALPKPTAGDGKWEPSCDGRINDKECRKLVDGDPGTSWQTKPIKEPFPHEIIINLRTFRNVNALQVTQPFDWESGGTVAGHKVSLSEDGKKWEDVAYGTWLDDETDKWAIFEPKKAKFVRLIATSASKGKQFVNIAELDVWANSSIPDSDPARKGKWGATVNFPLVPVGVFIDPLSGKVISFSSDSHDGSPHNVQKNTTWTAVWNPSNNEVSEKLINETNHNMFCPGMAFDVNGSMIITGGDTSDKTSTYDIGKNAWKSLAQMKIRRGYQGSTTCADGRIFVIGGSWSPDVKDSPQQHRFGELYDPSINDWQKLDNCPSETIETETDNYRAYRADNHVWVLAWKKNTIFHAGPAAEMHWISTAGKGAITAAGRREVNAAMCGVAAMYDAEAGKILSAGGAPQYEFFNRTNHTQPIGKPASKNAFIITLGDIDKNVTVEKAGKGLNFPRTFHNAVILPNGDTFVAGGQEIGEPFTDDTAELRPEMYSLKNNQWDVMAPNSIPRTYHSFGLLLPDATVLVGGGGLCPCAPNHFDAQIYTPPYLLSSSRARPVIIKVLNSRVHLKGTLTFIADSVIATASLIRYGGATHTVNNDQRRIRLTPVRSGTAQFQYDVKIPEDAGVALPGYWMLFVMNDAGVPSVASTVLILCRACKVMPSKVGG